MKTEAERNSNNELLCPTCKKSLLRLYSNRNIFRCDEHGLFKLTVRRKKRVKDMNDSNNWKAKCDECGGVMDYYNFRYGCRKCGNILEV